MQPTELCVTAHELAKQFLLLSLIVENTFDGVENEWSDLIKVVEDTKEMIRLVWIQYRDSLTREVNDDDLAIFDGNINDKVIAGVFDENSVPLFVDMNWFCKHWQLLCNEIKKTPNTLCCGHPKSIMIM